MSTSAFIQSARQSPPSESAEKSPLEILGKQDRNFEVPLRPKVLEDFLGQEPIKERLEVLIGAAKQRGEALGHCLFCGPPGLGKTTLAMILSREMGTDFVVTSGPVLEKAADLAGILSNLKRGDVLFIDEIHRLSRTVEEYLYPAMEDFVLDLMIDTGPAARSLQIKLNPFTLVGATTRQGLLTGPLRSRFPFTCRLDYYTETVLQEIIARSGKILGLEVPQEVAAEIAARCRGTPRIANNLLRWVRDFSQMRTEGRLGVGAAREALAMLGIDEEGLEEMDRRLLVVLIDHYQGGPVGLNALATALGEEAQTLEEVYEPYLILKGFIRRMARGREATEKAYRHIGRDLLDF